MIAEKSLAQRFASGMAWNMVGKVLLGVMGFLISILIARSWGKENLGIYAIFLTIPAMWGEDEHRYIKTKEKE